MARRGRRCAVSGCGRRVRPGMAVCRDHAQTAAGEVARREVQVLVDTVTELAEQDVSSIEMERFRRRMERGTFAALFAGRLEELLLAQGEARDLQREIGAMRLSMLRLLTEVEDPLKQAKAVMEMAGAVQAALEAEPKLEPGPGKHERILGLIAQFKAEQRAAERDVLALEAGRGRQASAEEREEAAEVALQEFVGEYWKREQDGRYVWDGPKLGEDKEWAAELERRRKLREQVW